MVHLRLMYLRVLEYICTRLGQDGAAREFYAQGCYLGSQSLLKPKGKGKP